MGENLMKEEKKDVKLVNKTEPGLTPKQSAILKGFVKEEIVKYYSPTKPELHGQLGKIKKYNGGTVSSPCVTVEWNNSTLKLPKNPSTNRLRRHQKVQKIELPELKQSPTSPLHHSPPNLSPSLGTNQPGLESQKIEGEVLQADLWNFDSSVDFSGFPEYLIPPEEDVQMFPDSSGFPEYPISPVQMFPDSIIEGEKYTSEVGELFPSEEDHLHSQVLPTPFFEFNMQKSLSQEEEEEDSEEKDEQQSHKEQDTDDDHSSHSSLAEEYSEDDHGDHYLIESEYGDDSQQDDEDQSSLEDDLGEEQDEDECEDYSLSEEDSELDSTPSSTRTLKRKGMTSEAGQDRLKPVNFARVALIVILLVGVGLLLVLL